MKIWQVLIGVLVFASTAIAAEADTALEPRAEVVAALKAMGDAANAHDAERHVGYYAHTPGVTLIVDGQPFVGWDAILSKQKEWWNNGKTDVVYRPEKPPEVLELAPGLMVTTLLMKAHRTLSDGKIKEGRLAVSAVWQKLPDGWKVVYSHESTTH